MLHNSSIVAFLLSIFLGLGNGSYGHEGPALSSQKHYINAEQIQLDRGRIYVHLQGQCLPVPSIHCDEEGLYVIAPYTDPWRYCPRLHPSPNKNGYCAVTDCPYYELR